MTGIDFDFLFPSEHCSIHFTSTFTMPLDEAFEHSCQRIRHANISVLASMIESVPPVMDPQGSDVQRLVKEYNLKFKRSAITLHHLRQSPT